MQNKKIRETEKTKKTVYMPPEGHGLYKPCSKCKEREKFKKEYLTGM